MDNNVIKKTNKKKKKYTHLLFIGPHFLIFTVFCLIPLIFGIYISFTRWNMLGSPQFVGLDNYKEILLNTSSTFHDQFTNGLKNTIIFVLLTMPLNIIIPFLISLAIQAKVKFTGLFQSVFYIPGLFSITAVGLVWSMIFNKDLGPINALLHTDIVLTQNQPSAWIAIVVMSLWWGIGGNMVIYIAAIAGVDKGLYEAASIDGAGRIKKFFYITLPSIKFQILYTTVMTVTACFNIYGQPLMLTKGGPNSSTHVLMMYIRNLAFGKGESIAGIGSAMAMMLGIVILVISLTQFKFMNFKGED